MMDSNEVRLQISFYGLWVCDIWYVNYVLAVEEEKHDTEKKGESTPANI
jgi:hypothetical protein